MKIKLKKLDHRAIIPGYAHEGDACFDLHSLEGGEIGAHSSLTVRTGLAFEIPSGHVMLIYSRSGHGFKNGIRLVNAVGVIDAGYVGEVAIGLRNDTPLPFSFDAGARMAQAMVIKVQGIEFEVVPELSETERGVGGFGSSGR